MENRVKIEAGQPKAYNLYALEPYLAATQLTGTQKNLIKIRASQINRCAYCINMHTEDATKRGETLQRIVLLDAWRETNLFTEEVKLILAITEEVTLISDHGLSDGSYKKAGQFFDESFIAQVIMAVVSINAWNRIAISTNMGFGIASARRLGDQGAA